MTWKPTNTGEPAWLCLDAKYRPGKKNLADAFESVHLYRDALHDSEFGGQCRTACLLAPASSEDTAVWFSDPFRAEFDTGIFQLTPGAMGSGTGELALGRWIAETLME